jgi:hypothetical protein
MEKTSQQQFTSATIQYVKELIAQGRFGAGLEEEVELQVRDVVDMLLYQDKKSSKKVTKRLGS